MDMMNIMHLQSQAQVSMAEQMRRRLENANNDIQNDMCPREKQAIREAAEAFESYFLTLMLREMRRTVPQDQGLFQKSVGERIFREMLDEEMSKEMARAGGIGLAQNIIEQLTRNYASNMR